VCVHVCVVVHMCACGCGWGAGTHTCMGVYGFFLLNFSAGGKTSAIWGVLYVTLRIISYLKVKTQG